MSECTDSSSEQPVKIGSFPKNFGYGPYDLDDDAASSIESNGAVRPRILLMGLRRSGKSSIQKVVFHKMSPNETLFLESTNKIVVDEIDNTGFVQFQIWDFPGQIDFFDPTFDAEVIFKGFGTLVYVIDARDDYIEALSKLNKTVLKAHEVNKQIKFEVFIHKVDGISDDLKIETQRDIHQRAMGDLMDAGLAHIHLSFYLTSIYDHSIFEAFSKVVQKLIPQLPKLENLLNIFVSNSGIEKAFLFDVVSKIYIATDSSPVDMQNYELCCDMIDIVIDLSSIYCSTGVTAFNDGSSSSIRLNNGNMLILREVNNFLALVYILRDYNYICQGVIDFNFMHFRESIHKLFEATVMQQPEVSLPPDYVSEFNEIEGAVDDNELYEVKGVKFCIGDDNDDQEDAEDAEDEGHDEDEGDKEDEEDEKDEKDIQDVQDDQDHQDDHDVQDDQDDQDDQDNQDEKDEKDEMGEKNEKAETHEMDEKLEKIEKAETHEMDEKLEKIEKAETHEKDEKDEKETKNEKNEKDGKEEKNVKDETDKRDKENKVDER